MRNLTQDWLLDCHKIMTSTFEQTHTQLPSTLRKASRQVAQSNRSWEWKWFWLQNAMLLLKQNELTLQLSKKDDWSQTHEEVFEGWNKSEHAQFFLARLNKGEKLASASKATSKKLTNQLIQLAIRHFGFKGNLSRDYISQFELGEFNKKSTYTTIKVDHRREVIFHTWDTKNQTKHLKSIETSLSVIKSVSPESYELFARFTRSITPIKQKEFVSYSLQSLPGHSFINLYHRDSLDLLDDLLHENGHHLLNLFLIQHSPLKEDSPELFYSPWRKTLRPIRGIYHAHCTFYFALKLYHDLLNSVLRGELDELWKINQKQKQKIVRRYLEEWHMLEHSSKTLKVAKRKNLINAEGLQLLREFELDRSKLGKLRNKALTQLTAKDKKSLNTLITELKNNR